MHAQRHSYLGVRSRLNRMTHWHRHSLGPRLGLGFLREQRRECFREDLGAVLRALLR